MGETFKRQIQEETGQADIKEILEEGKEFMDKFAESIAEGRTILQERKELEGSAQAVASQNKYQDAKNKGENKEMEIDKVITGLQKLRAFKGDIKLSEAEEFIDENRGMVKKAINGDLA